MTPEEFDAQLEVESLPVTNLIEKRCTKCGVIKPLAEFNKNKISRDGRFSWCRPCAMEGRNRSYAARIEKEHTRRRAYRAANREKVRAEKKAWYRANAEKLCAERRARRKANPEKVRAALRAWRAANIERARTNRRVWAKANPEKVRATYKTVRRRRRAQKYKVPSVTITPAMEAVMYQDQGGRCFYCREDLNGSYDVEHKLPLLRGGHDTPDNLCLSCRSCNLAKGILTDVEFFARRAEEAGQDNEKVA